MKNSTATGTTATAEPRCAPAIAGALHPRPPACCTRAPWSPRWPAGWMRAPTAAAGCIRIEDLDTPRIVPGAEDAILATLDAPRPDRRRAGRLRQSQRHELYRAALDSAAAAPDLAYRCTCSRSENRRRLFRALPRLHPASSRDLPPGACAWMPATHPIRGPPPGTCNSAAADLLGDPVIFRRDGVAAYQLAVVVDDAAQGITRRRARRGPDGQHALADRGSAQALGLPAPRTPMCRWSPKPDGSKLAKSRRSCRVERMIPRRTLLDPACCDQDPPDDWRTQPATRILRLGHCATGTPARLAGRRSVALPREYRGLGLQARIVLR